MLNIKYFIPNKIYMILQSIKKKLENFHKKFFLCRIDAITSQASKSIINIELYNKMYTFSKKYKYQYLHTILKKGWQKPGHMFDELGEIFSVNRTILLIGDVNDVERATKKLEFIGVEIESMCVSRPKAKDIVWITDHTHSGYTVVIVYKNIALANMVMEGILQRGRHFINVNVFLESDFIGDLASLPKIYLGIFAVYTTGKVYLIHNNMLTTTICNLNCEYCLNYTPYDKHPQHFPLEELKHSTDIYFSHIDRVGLFELTGGEPMLYPHLREILEYIANHYREKIGILAFVTNGSVVPDDDFLDFCKREKIFVFLDNYIKALPRIQSTFTETLHKLEKYGIAYMTPEVASFVKSFPPLRANFGLSEVELQHKYRSCHIGVQNLRDGKLCSCTYHAFAVNAGLIPDASENWFDMAQMTDDILDKRKLVEFRFGFNQKGYVDWCQYCNGHITINSLRAPAARQAKGRLTWDRNNPTFLDDEGADSHAR